jgi:hypothetical protein
MSVGIISFHEPTVRDRGLDANEYYSGCNGVGAQIQIAKRLIAEFVETRPSIREVAAVLTRSDETNL